MLHRERTKQELNKLFSVSLFDNLFDVVLVINQILYNGTKENPSSMT